MTTTRTSTSSADWTPIQGAWRVDAEDIRGARMMVPRAVELDVAVALRPGD